MGGIVRERVIKAGVLEFGKFGYAGDAPGVKKANNKLNFDHLFEDVRALQDVARFLGKVVNRYQPDALIGVPSGGERLCDAVNLYAATPLPLIHLQKIETDSPGEKKFEFVDYDDQERLQETDRIVIIEDVFNKFTSTRGVLAVEGVLEKTAVAIAVWDRGNHPSRTPLTVPYEALHTEYIPRYIRIGEPLYFNSDVSQ